MDTEPDRRVSCIIIVIAAFLVLLFTAIPAQFLSQSAANVYYPVFLIVVAVLVFGVIGWVHWVNGVPENEISEKEERRKQIISNRMFHWAVGLPSPPDQIYIFLLTIGGDLCIFSSVFWMLRSFYVPERKGILMALIPVFLFQIGKMFAEINLHPFVHDQKNVGSGFTWSSLLIFTAKLCLAAGVYAGGWYVFDEIYRSQKGPVFMTDDFAFMFYLLGGGVIPIDFDDLYDGTGGSIFLIGLVLLFALACLILLCVMYSTDLIVLERTL